MIRVAAIADVHIDRDSAGTFARWWNEVHECADLLLIAGDLTKCGTHDEIEVFLSEIRDVRVPVVTVLGNHDHHAGHAEELARALDDAGVPVLDGDAVTFAIDGTEVGIAGIKGFGGGFAGACATAFGEHEMKAFVEHTEATAARLDQALKSLDADRRVVLLHYAPIAATLEGEPKEIYPFLGSYLLAEVIDAYGADLVLHGHAHRGKEKGTTPRGAPVRNVAQPVVGAPFRVFELARDHAATGA